MNTTVDVYFFLGVAFLGFVVLDLAVLAFLGLLAAFLGAADFFAFLGLFVVFSVAAAGFLTFLGDFLAAGFFALGAAFLAGFFLVSVCFLLNLKDPEAPVPLTCTRAPLITRLLMASLTREFFFSTS